MQSKYDDAKANACHLETATDKLNQLDKQVHEVNKQTLQLKNQIAYYTTILALCEYYPARDTKVLLHFLVVLIVY